MAAKVKVQLEKDKEKVHKLNKEIILSAITPDLESFRSHFNKVSGSDLTRMEIEILKAYLFYKLVSTE